MKIQFLIAFFIFSCFFTTLLNAQQEVTGRITEAYTGKPMPYASIRVSNTTIGTVSDELGNYSMTVPGRGNFEIVVSYLGYYPIFYKVNVPDTFHEIDFALRVNEIAINEVTISAKHTGKSKHTKKDIDLFWRTLLGEKPSKNGLEVLNPNKMYYYLNKNNIFKASCNEPIEIINHKTGYRIHYILKGFQYNYNNREFEYGGAPCFEELKPQDNHEKNRWEKTRKEVYAASITHFLKALYNQQLHEEGFLLFVNGDSIDKNRIYPVELDDILQMGEDEILLNIETPLLLICISEPVTAQMIEDDYKQIWAKNYPIVELMPQQLIIHSDGSYIGVLVTRNIRYLIVGLSAILPLDYN